MTPTGTIRTGSFLFAKLLSHNAWHSSGASCESMSVCRVTPVVTLTGLELIFVAEKAWTGRRISYSIRRSASNNIGQGLNEIKVEEGRGEERERERNLELKV